MLVYRFGPGRLEPLGKASVPGNGAGLPMPQNMGDIVGIEVAYVCAVASRCAVGPTQDLVRSFGQRDDVDLSGFPWHVVGGVLRRTDRSDDRGAAEST